MILTDTLFLDIAYKIHEDMEDVYNSGNQYFSNDQHMGKKNIDRRSIQRTRQNNVF